MVRAVIRSALVGSCPTYNQCLGGRVQMGAGFWVELPQLQVLLRCYYPVLIRARASHSCVHQV